MFTTVGYPPADVPVYKYLSAHSRWKDAFIRSCAFLHALFHQTSLVLKDATQPVAKWFRDHMTGGMTLQGHGPSRQKFYENVSTLTEV